MASKYVLVFKNVSEVISNQTMRVHSYYQEAMLATISHEQMNPLHSIINFTEYMKKKTRGVLESSDSSDQSESSCKFSNDSSSNASSTDLTPVST